MSSLLNLPQSVLAVVLSQWSSSKDLVNFDSATCNFKYREIFLNVTQLPAFILSQSFNIGGMIWASKRKIKCQRLSFKGNDLLKCPKELMCSKVISLSFTDIKSTDENNILNIFCAVACASGSCALIGK